MAGRLVRIMAAALGASVALATSAGMHAAAQQPAPPASQPTATELAKKIQNPIGDLYSLPFQANTNFSTGPNKGTEVVLNIQPVIPVHLNEDWNVITRTILPLVWSPSMQPAQSVPFGTGPVTFSAFLSPRKAIGGWVWGVGPVLQLPTASNPTLGSSVWGAGPSAVVVKLDGPWVWGGLINNVWSLGGHDGPTGKASGGTRYNLMTMQPFLNYNFGEGWYVTSSPIITANWLTAGDKAWTVPVGGGAGRVVRIGGKLPLNLMLSGYWNAVRPEFGATWQMRAQATLIF
jgi:hypothetical protein